MAAKKEMSASDRRTWSRRKLLGVMSASAAASAATLAAAATAGPAAPALSPTSRGAWAQAPAAPAPQAPSAQPTSAAQATPPQSTSPTQPTPPAQPTTPAAGTSAADETGTRVYNVTAYGANGDGQTLCTTAIQSAIDACTADRGGIVLVPAGTFLIGPIQLKDHVTLRIAAGGRLLGTTEPARYHPANGIPLQGDHTMGDGNVGLVYASEARNVTLEGPGTIDGQGAALRAAGLTGVQRAHLTLFYKCTNLTIRDIAMEHSEYHTCRICNSSYVQLDGIRIFTREVGNNDGFHFISADHVRMTNCDVQSGDDACALFGSCQFITITNCLFSTRWAAFRFGGGIAKNIAVSNCVLYQVFGCPIKLRCQPGSIYEHMSFSNLVFDQVSGPISIGAGTQRPSDPPAAGTGGPGSGGIVRHISFSNITGTVVTKPSALDNSKMTGVSNPGEQHSCIILNCVPGNTIEHVTLSDIHLTFGGGGTAEDAARRELPLIANEYFSLGPMPAYGLYARNARAVTLSNVRFDLASPDVRPALIFDGVRDASIFGLVAEGNPRAESLLRFIDTADVLVTAPRVLSSAAVFLRLEGRNCSSIAVDGDLTNAGKPIEFVRGAGKRAVKLHT